jgi:hypothetical protein
VAKVHPVNARDRRGHGKGSLPHDWTGANDTVGVSGSGAMTMVAPGSVSRLPRTNAMAARKDTKHPSSFPSLSLSLSLSVCVCVCVH